MATLGFGFAKVSAAAQDGFPSVDPVAPAAPPAPAVQPAAPPEPVKTRRKRTAPAQERLTIDTPAKDAVGTTPDPEYAAYLAAKRAAKEAADAAAQAEVRRLAEEQEAARIAAEQAKAAAQPPLDPEYAEFLAAKRAKQASAAPVEPVGRSEDPAASDRSMLPHERALAVHAAKLPARQNLDSGTALIPSAAASDQQISTDDLLVPKIQIAQQIGDLGRMFRQGDVILNRQVCLHHPQGVVDGKPEPVLPENAPVEFIVLFFKNKLYVEKKAGGQGRLARSQEEVASMGGTILWADHKTNDKPLFQTLATAVLVIRQPKHLGDELFPFHCPAENSNWAIAQWGMKGAAYTSGARVIYTARRIGGLRKSWTAHAWQLKTKLQAYEGGHSAYIPVLQPGKFTTPQFVEWLANTLSGKDLDTQAGADDAVD